MRLVAVLAGTVLAAATGAGAEFEPDAATLFLAHFNGPLETADYALGIARFCGNGARPVEGYYGGGIDLRSRGLAKDFPSTCADFTPRFDGWGFRARGNLDPAQGTLECWFQPDTGKRPAGTRPLGVFLGSTLQRSVPHPDKSRNMYASFEVSLSTYALRYVLPTVAGGCFAGEVVFSKVPGYQRSLDAGWHHFALNWSQGEMVIWIDGRPAATFDMTGQWGLVAFENPVRYLSMAECVLDELRISSTVRYQQDFEPGWREGRRPASAFTGVPGLARHDARLMPAPLPRTIPAPQRAQTVDERLGDFVLRLDRATGALVGLNGAGSAAEGLILHKGLERAPLLPRAVENYRRRDDVLRFSQRFDADVEAAHRISSGGRWLAWQVTLVNHGPRELWLEPVLGLPCPGGVEEFFDGCQAQRAIGLARHRDEYCLTLPLAAASGAGRFLGVGTDPHTDLNDIVTEWLPDRGGAIRQGTKIALAPGESFTIPFRVVAGRADFDTLDAVAAFHDCFPDLYALQPDVPVYSSMPATQDITVDESGDMKRVGYAGGFWGHGPGHDKGDEFGRPEWWDNPEFYDRREYQSYTRRIERLWGTLDGLRENITYNFRRSFENYYPVRRFHTCPDLTPEYIVQSLWPGHRPNEDPLCFGQYYVPITNWWIVNEYNTPIGAFFRETTRNYYRQCAGFCVGFINDMSHAGALYRHNDPIAQNAPGRSFSRDLGTFVRKALGRKQRYEVLNRFVDGGHRASFWSDGGAFSYTLCAYSAAIAIEGAALYKDLTGTATYVIPARYLLGEKPLSAMTHMNDDWTGYYLKPDEFTSESLREYYRFADAQLTLFCLRYGVTLDPTSYMWGRQISLERAPLMVESSTLGRKLVPGARVEPPLWVCRAGDTLRTLLVIGNHRPETRQTNLETVNRYFGGALLLAPYYGGRAEHAVTPETTTVAGVRVEPRDLAAFKAVGLLECDGPASATSTLAGDGIALRLAVDVTAAPGAALRLADFAPLYQIRRVAVNGRPTTWLPGEPIALPDAKSRVEVDYANRAFEFTPSQWKAVELIKDGATNFCLVADAGVDYGIPVSPSGKAGRTFAIGYERGTAAMLNDFVAQYDEEDGRPGTLRPAPLVSAPPEAFQGWTVRLAERPGLAAGRVRIESDLREIIVEGPTQGEMRRAMVVLLRLVDRKYPHVGRFFPLRLARARYEPGKPAPLAKWIPRKLTFEFYEKVSDPLFLAKPVLRPEYEELYAGGNMDFAGKYALRASPYLFEPTYGDDFVYGYSGPGKAASREELHRAVNPSPKAPAEQKK